MYSLEKWLTKTHCRVLGAAGRLEDVKAKAEQDAHKPLQWVEWPHPGICLVAWDNHTRYEIRGG